jgi:phosphatidylglycerophosphate synthase
MASEPERLGDGFGRSWTAGVDHSAETAPERQRLLVDALVSLSVLMAATAGGALFLSAQLRLGWDFVGISLLCLASIFSLVVYALPDHPHARFGAANLVTAFRACLVSLAGAALLLIEDLATREGTLWFLLAVILFALALDGIDGYLARRNGHESRLGARFDMEVDALLILILSLAAHLLGKAGLWVLLIGLMRYGFVAAGWILPRLNSELPPSFRRKLVCVVQIGVLCIILVPFVTPPVSTAFAAAALLALVYSFSVDVLYLLRQADRS